MSRVSDSVTAVHYQLAELRALVEQLAQSPDLPGELVPLVRRIHFQGTDVDASLKALGSHGKDA